ncbi:MAG: sensor domain-containing protein [Ancrocorticia sp.]
MEARTAWQAIAQRPLGFVATVWPWRALVYLLSGVMFGAVTALVLMLVLATGVLTTLVLVGIAILASVALAGVPVAAIERRRLRLIDLDPAPDPHVKPAQPGAENWVRTRINEQVTWRELGFMALSVLGLWWVDGLVLFFAFGVPFILIQSAVLDSTVWPLAILGAVVIPTAPFIITVWAAAHGALARAVLAPRDAELGRELTEVKQSRERLVTAFETERVRIERDLHDGPQQRLASLRLILGMMQLDVPAGSSLATQLEQAQQQAADALAELRDVARGVRPQVLTDNGLASALTDLGNRFAIPVTVQASIPRLATNVETTAYYVAAELLSNIAKHSGAIHAEIQANVHNDVLTLTVIDDGVGGADPQQGDGLTGLADRLAVVNGRLRISSPQGGPTLAHMEIPCRIS